MTDRTLDVLIVGAGLSGINAAYRLREKLPDLDYEILEARTAIGGTWDLFRYPGVRSDSDFFTLSFPFKPWKGEKAIVDGASIREYLEETARENGIVEHIQFSTRVTAVEWSSAEARWTVHATGPDGQSLTYLARFLFACTGYYDYEAGHDPGFAGIDDFTGTIAHPQFWPEDLDHTGKRVVVIGSGATAATVVPAMAATAEHVTMLQRTPTYMLAQPASDAIGNGLRKVLPAQTAHRVIRAKNTALQWGLFQACQRAPKTMRSLLRKGVIAGTGSEAVADAHFNPPYDPWDQRLCIVPGGDLFTAIRDGRASVVTGRIDRFVPEGIRLENAEVIEADIVVPATGLSLKLLGGIDLSVDGQHVAPSTTYAYLGAMLSGVPNFAFCVGYINLSWTMRSDMTAKFVARVVDRLKRGSADVVIPRVAGELADTHPIMDMESGYLRRGAHLMPRTTDTYPWAMRQNYLIDAWSTSRADLDDGLVWSRVPTAVDA